MIPERTLDQRREALAKGDRIRSLRAQLKKDIRDRKVRVVDIIVQSPEWVATMPVGKLIAAAPYYGPTRTRKLCRRAGIAPELPVGRLTVRQQTELLKLAEVV